MTIDTKRVFLLLSVAVALVLPVLSLDFGITEDEQLHAQHGESILDYFLGRSDRAARHPLDADGRLTFDYDAEMRDRSGALNIYGGFFDLLCAATQRWLSPLGRFEHRHLVNSLFGVLLIVIGGVTARQIGGWRAGLISLVLLAACPRILGHSMNNPVDLPFAALYLFCVCFLLRFVERLPRLSAGSTAALLIGIPLATGVRIAGLVLLCYVVLFAALWHVPRVWSRPAVWLAARAIGLAVLLATVAYLLVSVPWPLAHRDPLGTPLLALGHLSRLETFEALDLFEGRWIARSEIPWYFVPKWFLIGSPLFVPLGLLLSPLAFVARWSGTRDGHPAIDRRKAAMLAFVGLFPVVFVILRGSNVYNDARHVLFALPPLIVLGALGIECVLRVTRGGLARAVAVAVLAATVLEPVHFMVRNYPHVVVYFSPWIGGVDGAWKRYETDYWGSSTRAAVEWIHANAKPVGEGPVRVRIWYGDQTKAAYYVRKRPGFEHVVAAEDSTDWDYRIALTVQAKHEPLVLERWPPPATVHEVLVDDTPLCAVVVNRRNREPESVLEATRAWAERRGTHAHLYALGTTAYLVGRHEEAVEAFSRAGEMEPEDAPTWFALGAAQGMLGRWDDQIAATLRALRIDPRFAGARVNLEYALRRRNETNPRRSEAHRSRDEYVEASLARFAEERYEESAEACRLALARDPTSAVAYNNLCAAYNAMRQYEEAREACEIAVGLDPDLPRARNNLAVARAGSR